MTWLINHPVEYDLFALPLVRKAIDTMATTIELTERGALMQGRMRDRVEFRRGRG